MKIIKTTIILLFAALAVNHANAQGCLPEGITFTTQEDIDSFQANYPGCTEIEGDLIIDGQNTGNITNLNGLSVLISIGGNLSICSNDALTSLSGLESLTSVGGDLWIRYNPVLSDCSAQGICNYLLDPAGSINISNNSPGCDNPPHIAANCEFTMPCMPFGNYYFTNQAEIDSFTINYPGCTEIEGDVNIIGNDINNLYGLNVVTSIGGDLEIEQNNALTSLTGLEYLTSIGDNLSISQNYNLASLTGLENLISIGNSFYLYANLSLASLAELESLSSIELSLTVSCNSSLSTLTGLEGVNSIGADLNIGGNDELNSLTGLDSLTAIGGDIHIQHNDALISLSELESLTYIGGDIFIFSNNSLSGLSGLERIDSIAGNLTVQGNPALTNMSGLDSLTSIGSYLNISYNHSLTNFSGLESLTSVGGDLNINKNNAMTSLSGLDNLISIGGDLTIGGYFGNYSLNDISSLGNLAANSIINLEIYNNSSLSQCDVQSICNYLSAPNGTIDIHDNAPGCNSPEQVILACQTAIDENKTDELTIFPNPSTSFITLTTPQGEPALEAVIYNYLGQKVVFTKPVNNTVDVSGLKAGMYLVEVVTKQSRARAKLVIE